VSFELVPGEIVALLGPNGAGKTTTLRMLGGLIHPTSGSVLLDQQIVTAGTASRLRASIGFLTEMPGLWERLTVRQNLTVYARLHGLASPALAVDRMLDLFRISDRGATLPASCPRVSSSAWPCPHAPPRPLDCSAR
jgi:ABC-2 type transport system ATP-binding protein